MRKTRRSPHSPETIARAVELRGQGHTYREVGEAVGASPQTVLNWCASPERREHIRRRETARKKKYTKPCIDCGGPTSYGKGTGSTLRCLNCHQLFLAANRKWTREAVIAAIQRWDREYGRPPSSTDWNTTLVRKTGRIQRDQELYPSSNTVYGRFDSWADAIEAAGFPRPRSYGLGTPKKRHWTEGRIIEALRAHAINGHGPTITEWMRAAPGRPTAVWVIRVFGSWTEALEAADLELSLRSRGRRRRLASSAKLSDERVAFVKRCMENNVLKRYIARLMWRGWGFANTDALKKALTKEGVVEELGWQYRPNRQLTQEEIEEGLSL